MKQFNNVTGFKTEINRSIDNKMKKVLDLFIVTSVNTATYTVDIRNFWDSTLQYSNVEVAGIGLGNMNGIIKLPKTDDMVLIAYIDANLPYVIGSLFTKENGRLIEADIIPKIKEGETLIIGAEKGSVIYFKINGNILFKKSTVTYEIGTEHSFAGIINASTDSIKVLVSTESVSDPPEQIELNEIFGDADVVGAGFMAYVSTFLVWSDGTEWKYAPGASAA